MGVQINGDTGNISATKADYSGNVTIGGTLTYEDVTNVDSIGIVTARNGIEVGARPGVAASISVDGNMIVSGITTLGSDVKIGTGVTLSPDGNGFFTGVITATTFSGVDTDKISEGNTEAEVVDTGSDGHFKVTTEGTERIRVGPAGQIGIAGANYGTSGQVLKSQGSGSAVQWASVGVSTSSLQVLEQFYLLADGRSVSTSNGTVTTTNVTTDPNLTDDFAEASGSSLTYHPPTGTTEIIYEYKFLLTENSSNDRFLAGYYVDIDGSEILESRSSRYGSAEYHDTVDVKYSFRVNTGGSNNATTGDRAGLTSMTIKTMIRRWASTYAAKIHFLQYYSNTSAISVVRRPYVGITAIGSLS